MPKYSCTKSTRLTAVVWVTRTENQIKFDDGGLMNKILAFLLFATAAILIMGNPKPIAAQISEHPVSLHLIEQHFSLTGVKGRVDHIAADPKRKLLFVSAVGNNTVEVVNLFGGYTVHSIT